MKRARAVIDANFGDTGKGLMVDYLCRTGGSVVVRFNGGAQAGHTVVTPEGLRHVFHHFGSGTLYGVPTFLSQFFICNPIVYAHEAAELEKLGVTWRIFAHPDCLVTTFADIIINRHKEETRGHKAHGSCGWGIHETMQRSQVPELKITMSDLWNHSPSLPGKLEQICDRWGRFRTGSPIDPSEITQWLNVAKIVAEDIAPAGIGQCTDPIFEGAQGLLLDQDRKEYHPHVTHSSTGMKNVRTLMAQAGISDIETYYVSRTYLTRHGAGPLPGYDAGMSFEDTTNAPNRFQGALRFAPLDDGLRDRCKADFGGDGYKLVLTHCDQLEPRQLADLYSYGPTRDNVRGWKDKAARAN